MYPPTVLDRRMERVDAQQGAVLLVFGNPPQRRDDVIVGRLEGLLQRVPASQNGRHTAGGDGSGGPKDLNRIAAIRPRFALIQSFIRSPQVGPPTRTKPSASAARISPTFRGLVKCSMTVGL